MSELAPGAVLASHYVIEASIGRGRTGTVYRARDRKLGRDVAIRFGNQAGVSAMAKLSHPNVVNVFELGEHEGLPYVVMEYVRGTTASEWLARPHTWREIVALFAAAGDGLVAAHAAGLLNSNFTVDHILIDGEGRPHVAALAVGTPDEQLAEERAFCAALTKALAHVTPPARIERLLASPPRLPELLAALRRAARPDRARRIALAIGALIIVIGAVWGIPAHRRELVRDACAAAAGEVAWSPGSRMAVAHALFGTGLEALEPLWRNTSATIDHFIAAWRTQAVQTCTAFEVDHSEEMALHQRREICLERARIELAAVVERLGETDRAHLAQTGRLVGALPDLGPCARAEALAPFDAVRRGTLGRYFAELAQVESLENAGRHDDAGKRVDGLVRLADELGSPRDIGQACYLAGQIKAQLGHAKEAMKLYERALTTGEAAGDDPLVAGVATELADTIGNEQAHYAEAQPYVTYARAAAERAGTAEMRAKVSQVVGRIELTAGHFDAAERAFEAAMPLAEASHEDDRVASICTDLSRLASARGKPAQAEPYDRRALAIYLAAFGPDHPLTLEAESNLGATLTELGRYDEARKYSEEVLVTTERVEGPDSLDLAYALNNVASTAAQAGQLERARETLDRSLVIFERTFEPTNPAIVQVVKNLGDIASYDGRWDDAAKFYTRALAQKPDDAALLLGLADIAFARNDATGGRSYCDRAQAATLKTDADNKALLVAIETCIGTAELAAGHTAGALERLERANALLAKLPDGDPSAVATTQFELARALGKTAPARALELAKHARELFAHEGAFATHQLADVDAWLKEHERK